MKVALVYDRVVKFGGAERVLLALHRIWPKAALYTAVYDSTLAPWADKFRVVTSFMQQVPLAKKHHELFPWLTPFAFESFDFSSFDLVISITSAEAKGIVTRPETLHICYCLSPTRYLWNLAYLYGSDPGFGWLNPLARFMVPLLSVTLRQWDQIAAKRADVVVAVSKEVARRIKKYYGINTAVIYPPVDTETFSPGKGKGGDYFLVVSRLVPYKRVDVVIEAFNSLGWPLVIVGSGSKKRFLKHLAKDNISFVPNLTDEELVDYYRGCRALIHAGIEDFGITSLEAQACGRPVVAYAKGGFAETVIEGETGEFFYSQTKEALINKLKNFNCQHYSSSACRRHALRFSLSRFRQKFQRMVKRHWGRNL